MKLTENIEMTYVYEQPSDLTGFVYQSLTLPSPKGTGIHEWSKPQRRCQIASTHSKQLPVKVMQLCLLLFFSLSESITLPDRYALNSDIACQLYRLAALSSSDLLCRNRTETRILQHVDGCSYSHLNYIQNVAPLFVSSYSAALLGFHCQVIWRCNRQLTRLISPYLKSGALRRFSV